jgi:hypothetical protein
LNGISNGLLTALEQAATMPPTRLSAIEVRVVYGGFTIVESRPAGAPLPTCEVAHIDGTVGAAESASLQRRAPSLRQQRPPGAG